MSDSESSVDFSPSLNTTDVDVDDACPAKVDLMSCNSSFSDCSLPCHELVTCSTECEPLPEGLVKVSVRPPQCIEPCVVCGPCGPCLCTPASDRDRYDIKFVSHIIDRPNRAKICVEPPFIPPPPPPEEPSPPPSPVISIPSLPPPITPSVSEETISTPTIISEPPPIVEEIPPPPPPPPPPSISIPSIVEPGVIGVSGTQVVTRKRKHYGDLCKLIRCSKPCPPPCIPSLPPCDQRPSPCDCRIPYEPCDHCVPPCYPCNNNQSNSCSSCPSCRPSSSSCCEDPCPSPCCKPPPPPCRPCCKVTWVRSITTKPVNFTNPLILKEIMDAEDEHECDEGSQKVRSTSQVSFGDIESMESSQSSQDSRNANINAGPMTSRISPSDDVNVGYRHRSFIARQACMDQEPVTAKAFGSQKVIEDEPKKAFASQKVAGDDCVPCDPWKPPPGMEQQTFERYVCEIVQTLQPVIPPNPFAVQRETCVHSEPDCDRIRAELERLLTVVDECCPNPTPPFPFTPMAVGSGCWPC